MNEGQRERDLNASLSNEKKGGKRKKRTLAVETVEGGRRKPSKPTSEISWREEGGKQVSSEVEGREEGQERERSATETQSCKTREGGRRAHLEDFVVVPACSIRSSPSRIVLDDSSLS